METIAPPATQRGFSPAWEGLLDNYPAYYAEGPEHVDEVGNRYQHYADRATGWRGLLIRWAGGGISLPYWCC